MRNLIEKLSSRLILVEERILALSWFDQNDAFQRKEKKQMNEKRTYLRCNGHISRKTQTIKMIHTVQLHSSKY